MDIERELAVTAAAYKPGDTAWVFIDPRSLAKEEVPVFECNIDDVSVHTRYDLRGNRTTEIEYTVSLTQSFDEPFMREAAEVFSTKEDAMKFGAELTERRAVEAEEKARRLREIADMMKAGG